MESMIFFFYSLFEYSNKYRSYWHFKFVLLVSYFKIEIIFVGIVYELL